MEPRRKLCGDGEPRGELCGDVMRRDSVARRVWQGECGEVKERVMRRVRE